MGEEDLVEFLLERLNRVGVHKSVAARYCKEAASEICLLRAALENMYVATRDNHRGALPPKMQSAYEEAGKLLFSKKA
jgi:hypothetical protein